MSKTDEKIIKLLSDYPEKEFYGQEIARKISRSKAMASNRLAALCEKGIILKRTRGHMKFYRINQNSAEIKRMKINWAMEKIRPILPALKKDAIKIILFGSASRGEQTAGSDLDLFVLASSKENVRLDLKKFSNRLSVNAIVKSSAEWAEMEVKEPELYREIKNGITLHNHVPRI